MKRGEFKVRNADTEESTVAELLVRGQGSIEPKVSVVMPVYNVEPYLRECLDSILGQSLHDLELICVDDGSTDASVDILQEYALREPRMTILRQKNCYAGIARNAGFSLAKGKYVIFLDSDDFFEKDMLQKSYDLIEKEGSDVLYFQYFNYIHATGEASAPRGIHMANPNKDARYFTCSPDYFGNNRFATCLESPWNKLIRASFLRKEEILFQGLPLANDVYFAQSVVACAQRVTLLYEGLLYYRRDRVGSLRNARDKHPYCFWKAYSLLAHTLKKKGLYEKLKVPYLRALIPACFGILQSVDVKKTEVRSFVQNDILPRYEQELNSIELTRNHKSWLERVRCPELVVSLTVTKKNIAVSARCIRRLKYQNVPADRILLVFRKDEFPMGKDDLPEEILALEGGGTYMAWSDNTDNLSALSVAVQLYPEAIHVVATDDTIYHQEWLRELFDMYAEQKQSKQIYCHSAVRMRYREDKGLEPLAEPPYLQTETGGMHPELATPSMFNVPRMAYGVLFPPGSWAKVNDIASDVELYVHAVRNGYKVAVLPTGKCSRSVLPGAVVRDEAADLQMLQSCVVRDKVLQGVMYSESADNERCIRTALICLLSETSAKYRCGNGVSKDVDMLVHRLTAREKPVEVKPIDSVPLVRRFKLLGLRLWKDWKRGDDRKRYLLGIKIYERKNGFRCTPFIREKQNKITYRFFWLPIWRRKR